MVQCRNNTMQETWRKARLVLLILLGMGIIVAAAGSLVSPTPATPARWWCGRRVKFGGLPALMGTGTGKLPLPPVDSALSEHQVVPAPGSTAPKGGEVQFAETAQNALRTNWAGPLFGGTVRDSGHTKAVYRLTSWQGQVDSVWGGQRNLLRPPTAAGWVRQRRIWLCAQ